MKLLEKYKPDWTVLDERPVFSALSRPLFIQGSPVGCLVLHGIGGTPANVRVVADALVAAGYTVDAPLLAGHGLTVRDQRAATADDWLSGVRRECARLREAGCTELFFIGLSLGGLLSGLLASEADDAAGLVLISAPVRMQPFLRRTRRFHRFVPVVRYAAFVPENPYAEMYDGFATGKLVDIDRLRRRLIRRFPSVRCPILILTAAHDNKVDPASPAIVRRRAVNAKSVEEIVLENSPHGSTYGPERDRAAAVTLSFVQQNARQ